MAVAVLLLVSVTCTLIVSVPVPLVVRSKYRPLSSVALILLPEMVVAVLPFVITKVRALSASPSVA